MKFQDDLDQVDILPILGTVFEVVTQKKVFDNDQLRNAMIDELTICLVEQNSTGGER